MDRSSQIKKMGGPTGQYIHSAENYSPLPILSTTNNTMLYSEIEKAKLKPPETVIEKS